MFQLLLAKDVKPETLTINIECVKFRDHKSLFIRKQGFTKIVASTIPVNLPLTFH